MSIELKNKIIVVIANEAWGDVWYSKHNYANELSKNNTVVFINPSPPWKIKNVYKGPELIKIQENLFVLNYSNYLPILNNTFLKLNDRLCSAKIKAVLVKQFGRTPDIFWSFDPHRLFETRYFSVKRSIFHVVDKYEFKFFGEKHLAKHSDLIVIVSKTFESLYSNLNKNIVHVPHGISSTQFISTEQPTLDYEGIYVGNIDGRVNFKLLEKILVQFPSMRFLFIGKFHAGNDSLARSIFIDKKYSNLIWQGSKPFNTLKNYIAKAKFCLSIMDVTHPGNDIAHHKTLQYLAFGKPIFGSIFKDYSEIAELIYQSNDDSELIKLMSNYFLNNESTDLISKRILYAQQFTYDKHILRIEKALNAAQK